MSDEATSEELELLPGKFSDRFIAYAIDLFPFLIAWAASVWITIVTLGKGEFSPQYLQKLGWVWVGVVFLYQFAGNLLGGTIGKRLMGLRVVRRDGTSLGFLRAFLRAVGYLLSTPFCNFGFILALFNAENRALDDMISGALVVETRRKNTAEAAILFLGAACAAIVVFGGNIFLQLDAPLPSDTLAVEKAREGLKILANVEEAHKAQNGRYTSSLSDLAQASGDVEEFRKAMLVIFQPDLFRIELGMKGDYRISAAAKDRKKTRVSIVGPVKPAQ